MLNRSSRRVVVGALGVIALLAAFSSPFSSGSDVRGEKVVREGTKVDGETAICSASGDRLILHFEGDEKQLTALENLAAQRILEAIHNDPNDNRWTLYGVLTEFRGRNFLLLKRVNRIVNKPIQ